jgi:hypothetical protein
LKYGIRKRSHEAMAEVSSIELKRRKGLLNSPINMVTIVFYSQMSLTA